MSWLALLVVGTALAFGLACGNDEAPASVATRLPTVLPTPLVSATLLASAPSPLPVATPDARFTPAFRDFAHQIEEALANEDIEFFRARLDQTTPEVCTADNTPPRVDGPACEIIGQRFTGFSIGEHRAPGGPEPPGVKGAIVPVEAAMSLISRLWDESTTGAFDRYGPATPALYAVGTDAYNAAKRGYSTVLTAITQRPPGVTGSGPLRVALILTWAPGNDGFRLVYLAYAYVQADEWLDRAPATLERMPVWERYRP